MTITLTREEAQQVLDALTRIRWAAGERDKKNRVRDFDDAMDVSIEAIEIIRARLAQPEPNVEPVAWRMQDSDGRWHYRSRNLLLNGEPLYTAPPQREWQGLTDEEISELIRATNNIGSFVRAIETKLKEKNFG